MNDQSRGMFYTSNEISRGHDIHRFLFRMHVRSDVKCYFISNRHPDCNRKQRYFDFQLMMSICQFVLGFVLHAIHTNGSKIF